ncbi:MAG: VCBS repeat-containing protein [Ignavibacteriae bacterium]|nr:VCBS repeat-containing protein [Ignavibacteriota bacterium]
MKRVQVVSVTLTLQFILTATVYSQFQKTTFGAISEIRAIKNPLGLFKGDFNGDGMTDLATYNRTQLLFQIQSSDSSGWKASRQMTEGGNVTKIFSAQCNSDRMSDLIVVDGKSSQIRIHLAKKEMEFYVRTTLRFKDEVPEVLTADINKDSKTDLLLFGKRESGLTVYLGGGTGGFAKSMTLFPEHSFSSVCISDMNDDGVQDIIASDWLENLVCVYRGYGRMKFGDPTVLRLDAEPTIVKAAYLDADSTKDIVVAFAHSNDLSVFIGDGAGDFTSEFTLHSQSTSDQLFLDDTNSDDHMDILSFNQHQKACTIWLMNESGSFDESAQLSCGRNPVEILLFSHQRTDTSNIAVVDSEGSTIRLMWNAQVARPVAVEMLYALSPEPSGIIATDLNGDTFPEVVVVNKQAKTFSFLMNNGDGSLFGQRSLSIPIHATKLNYNSKNGQGGILIASNREEDKLSITEFTGSLENQTTYTLPIQRGSQILSRYVDKQTKQLHFFVLERDTETKQFSIIKFSQIAPTKYVEQNIISRFEPSLIAAAMNDFDKDGDNDIAFLGQKSSGRTLELRRIIRSETTNVVQPFLDFTIDKRETPPTLMWSADVTGDGYPDLIMNFQKPENSLVVSVNGTNGIFLQPKFQSRFPVSVSSRDQLRVFDVNNDGRMDIVVNNSLTKEIQVYWGAGNGQFPNVNRLISAEGIGGFTVADINADGIQELIVTDSMNGWLKVISLR